MGSVLVLDYPQARTRRLMLALRACAIDARLSESPLQAKNADHLIVPDGDDDDEALARGVGRGVLEALAAHIQKERPTLCIGLGLHFLLEGSAGPESPPGLGVFHAGVQRFDPRMTDEGERPLAWRRQVLEAMVERIVVRPGRSDRVSIEWSARRLVH